ncbi:porin family protein [bacterium]|nr:porin family protein [bacterium]MBU1990952.1 porin family protein [bacterium]
MKIIVSFLLLLSLLHADREGGPYIGAGIGLSKYNDDNLYASLQEDTSKSLTFYGGAYINRHLSVELAYVSFDSWHVDKGYEVDSTKSLGFGALSVSTLAHYAFFEDALDFYAKFGVGEMTLGGINSSGFTMLVGGGAGYRLNDWLSVKVAYDVYVFDYDDVNEARYSMQIDYIYTAVEVQF